jgi:hypothetical protein
VIEYRTNWEPDQRVYVCRWRGLAVIDDAQVVALTGDAPGNPPG